MSSERLQIHTTPLADLKWLARKQMGDERGFLERLFCTRELASITQGRPIQQINHTLTQAKGTVRGIHFRHAPHDEIKMVSCLKGAILDVAVDLRPHSSSYLHWFALELTEDNLKAMILPEGFGHGYQTLTENCELIYFHTGVYEVQAEDGVHCLDPALAITWPLPIIGLSVRDQSYVPLSAERKNNLR